jgi:cytochrome c oxidase subunit IV
MSHASLRQYLAVFLALAVLTAIELGVVYVPGIGKGTLVALLTLLALTKAALVGLFYMHLRSETRTLKLTVVLPLALAPLLALAVIVEAVARHAS